jgi:uncharacterized protein involved in tolerance to divalent cations
MKSASQFLCVLMTAPDLKSARKLAGLIVRKKLAACVNVIPAIESHYQWEGKIEQSAEVLCIIKTSRTKLKDLESLILKHHPYDTPEILTLPLEGGNERYLNWLEDSLQ